MQTRIHMHLAVYKLRQLALQLEALHAEGLDVRARISCLRVVHAHRCVGL